MDFLFQDTLPLKWPQKEDYQMLQIAPRYFFCQAVCCHAQLWTSRCDPILHAIQVMFNYHPHLRPPVVLI